MNVFLNLLLKQDLIEWVSDTAHPDEHLFNTLQFSPHLNVPGSYNGNINLYKCYFGISHISITEHNHS